VPDRQELYGLPLERFIRERGALAKQLRQQGDRERAAAVSSLRKPSVAAWAVNQLVRSQRREVDALFAAGDELQQAQAELLAGRGNGQTLRRTVERERAAVEELVERAQGLLSGDGHELTQTTLGRVADTLHAAALDRDARSQVADGCLERELRHVGLGAGDPSPPRRRAAASASKDDADAKRAARERSQQLKAARRSEADARRAADRADRDLRSAQGRRDDAESALDEADAALAEARRRAEQAAAEHARAQQALEQL
jgi:hypothetical protein